VFLFKNGFGNCKKNITESILNATKGKFNRFSLPEANGLSLGSEVSGDFTLNLDV
jgi:hypothetical protein